METIKNSVGIWAFGPAVTRFVPPGYHPEAADEPRTEKTRRVCEGLDDILDGLAYRYPGEVNEENVEEILSILKEYGMDRRSLLLASTPTLRTPWAPRTLVPGGHPAERPSERRRGWRLKATGNAEKGAICTTGIWEIRVYESRQ